MLSVLVITLLIVAVPTLLLGLCTLAFEIGLTATVALGLVSLIVAGVIPVPVAVSLVLSCGIVWVVCRMLMNSVRADNAESAGGLQ